MNHRIISLIVSTFALIASVLLFAEYPLAAAEEPLKLPAPRSPQYPRVTSADQLMPWARNVMKFEARLKPGEKVLIVSDQTAHSLVRDALAKAVQEAGGKVDVIILQGFPEIRKSAEVARMWAQDWWPQWVWDAQEKAGYNILFINCFLTAVHAFHDGIPVGQWWAKRNIRIVRVPGAPEAYAYSPIVEYPRELAAAIVRKLVQEMPSGRVQVHVTDPEGTDLTLEAVVDHSRLRPGFEYQGEISPNIHYMWAPAPLQKANGVIVTSNLHVGPIQPKIKMVVKDSRVVEIEGGGEVAEEFKETFAKYQNINFGGHPGPGVNWLEELSLQTHPKIVRGPNYYQKGGSFSSLFSYAMARQRSGVLHMAVGSGAALVEGGQTKIPKVHRDIELYFATLTVNGKKIVENGRLLVLDDPEIRKIATQYGDPDELLREAWVPKFENGVVRSFDDQ